MEISNNTSLDYDVSEALTKEGLTTEDFNEICRRLKRPPNRTELGMFGVMWSEHCCYRNSRPLLQGFPTKGEHILVGPGENAGVVDLGLGQSLVFKIESHNHPSAIEPFQGAATGVGGILRDIFTMGARPIAILNALRFGPLEDEKNVSLLEGVVSGIAHYGNCVGVPTIGGEIAFDHSYSGNPLVNAMALGLLETQDIVCSGAKGIGYSVIYVGSTTGRDGMGGASFASSELTKESLDDRPAVQVGDPFLEKGLIEACLEAFKSGDVIAAQDMGAAGITCSCSEMAAKGGLGIEIDLDKVPARESGMSAYEFLLSESQERMLFVVKPGKENDLMFKFKRWGLQAAVVGKVLEQNVVRVLINGSIAADIPANALAEDTPINKHILLDEEPKIIKDHWKWTEDKLPTINFDGISLNNNQHLSLNLILLKLLDDPTIASKKWIYRQYDYQVQANTVIAPGFADAAITRLRPQEKIDLDINYNRGVASVVDCPNRWVALDPIRGSMAAVVEAARNLSCVGAKPLAVTNNLNFSSPETSFGYWQLAMACKGLSRACLVMETPITGGNVSLYNETKLEDNKIQPIHPTPVIGMVGLVNDLSKVVGQGWTDPNDEIWMLGVSLETTSNIDTRITLSGSSYLENVFGLITGRPPEIDLEFEKYIQSFLRKGIFKSLIRSAHDISDGGLAVALAECCISSTYGAEIHLEDSSIRLDRLLFGEGGGRIIVTISSKNRDIWYQFIKQNSSKAFHNWSPQYLGNVIESPELLIYQGHECLINLSKEDLSESFENAIPRRMGLSYR